MYKNKILKCFACSVLGLTAIPGVSAEEPDLRSLLLGMTEARDAASTSGATKKLEGSMAAPAILKVFTQSDIERYDSVYELLRTVTGITIDDGNFGREYINIRNIQNGLYNNKVLLMINGFKITDPAGPHFFIETIPKESIKRLEVIKGPGSVLYGSNAFAGVINIETFDGSGYEQNEWSAFLGTDSVRGASAKFFKKSSVEKNHFFALRFYNDGGGERDNELVAREFAQTPANGYTRKLAGQEVLRLYPGDAEDFKLENENYSFFGRSKLDNLNLSYGRSHIRRDRSYQENSNIPFMGGLYEALGQRLNGIFALSAANPAGAAATLGLPVGHPLITYLGTLPTRTTPAAHGLTSMFEPGRAREDVSNYQTFIGADYTKQLSPGLSLKIMGKLVDSKENLRFYDYAMFNVDCESTSKELELQLHHNKLDNVSFIFGYNREWVDVYQKTWGAGVRQVSNFLNDFWAGVPGALGAPAVLGVYDEFDSLPRKSLFMEGIYLQSDWKISDRLNFLAANRYNRHEIVGTGYSPKYALVYQLKKDEYLKVIYGKSFRYPSPFELFNDYKTTGFTGSLTLKPELIESFEYNWVKSFNENRSTVSITWYDMDMTDYIVPTANGNDNTKGGARNISGLEIDYHTRVSDSFAWWANASFADAPENIASGAPGGGVWNNQLSLGTDFKIDERWSFYTASNINGARSSRDRDGDFRVEKAYVHNVGLKYAHSNKSEVRVDAINIFDKEYSTSHPTVGTAKMETPPRGRKIFLSYRIKF